MGWTLGHQSDRGGVEVLSAVLGALAVASLAATSFFTAQRRAGLAFGATTLAIVSLFVCLFADLFPYAMVSSTDPGFSLSLAAASSSHYTLTVMTVVAALFVPLVILYQGWTYWVFRARLGAEDFEDVKSPLDLLDRKPGEGGGSSSAP